MDLGDKGWIMREESEVEVRRMRSLSFLMFKDGNAILKLD
jgi:hypothetical protein